MKLETLTLTQKAINIEKLLDVQERLHPIYRKKLLNTLWELEDQIKNLSNQIIGGSK